MTAPAPTGFPADPPRTSTPSFLWGLLLNLLLPGAGFTLIGAWVWHLVWAVGTLFLLGLTMTLLTVAWPLGVLSSLLSTAGMLWHYAAVYRQQAARRFLPRLDTAVQVILCVGHAFLGFFVVGILAAVLIPNLLVARNRADAAAEQSVSRQIMLRATVQGMDGVLKNGPCAEDVLADVRREMRERVTACTVDASDPTTPRVSVSFRSGHTVTLP